MKFKRLFIIAFTFLFVSLFAVSLNVGAATVETSDLIELKGAQVRTSGNAGIRFVASEAYEGENETAYGIILAFGEVEASDEFVIDGTVNGKEVVKGEVNTTYQNEFYVTLYDIPQSFYEQKITARAYVVDGDKVVYSSEVCTRSLADVVNAAYEDGNDTDFVKEVYAWLNAPTFNYNGGEYECYEFAVTKYNSGSDGYSVTLCTTAKQSSGSNYWWDRIFLADTEVENVYDVVGVYKAGVNSTPDKYDYVIALHSNCSDAVSAAVIKQLIALANVADYYMVFEMPTTADCNVQIKATTDVKFLNEGKVVMAEGEALPNAVKDYYKFEGWYDNAELEGEAVTNHNGSKNYYAKYTPVTYTITYHLNNGSTTATLVEEYTVESDEIALPAAETMSIENGSFIGWYTNSAFTGEAITAIPAGSNGNIDVYASWYSDVAVEVELSAADEAAINALTPTMIVYPEVTNGKYSVNGVVYESNKTAFATISAALANAKEGDKVYVFAGTYAEGITVSAANVTVYGPNYGIKGTATRNAEAVIDVVSEINGAGAEINGLKFTKAIKVGADNVTITNSYIDPTATVVCNGGNRQGCIVNSVAEISDLTVSNCFIDAPGTSNSYLYQYMSFGTVANLTITGNYISNSAQATASGSYAGMRIYNCSGTMNITNNEFNWGTTGYLAYIGDSSNTCTEINIIDNVINKGAKISTTAGILIKRGSTKLTTTIMGNEIYNCTGSTFLFNNDTGSTVKVMYNNFGAGTSYKVGTVASAKISYTNNYYAVAQTTATSDKGVIASVAALEEAYAAYKNAQ